MKKGMSTMEISRQFGIQQQTAWYCKRKIQSAIQNGDQPKLKDIVEIDETAIGGYQQGAPGRAHGKKQMVQVAVEMDYSADNYSDKAMIKNSGATIIDGYS